MNELLDEVTEIPFSIFWMKYLENGGILIEQTRAHAVWWQLKEKERSKAFTDVCKEGTTDPAYKYLKEYYESIR